MSSFFTKLASEVDKIGAKAEEGIHHARNTAIGTHASCPQGRSFATYVIGVFPSSLNKHFAAVRRFVEPEPST